ncbi:microfibril-associated glycoprotein 4-like [Drosophila kikkawai]|uniref:Microfibril-associated glycoprotein 4-like n=1 Tax=Drosophila kikkawai TaxID=30033 RepID=A0A6P4IY65_DROKI|nr:fibrinogen-like protein 1 [Drosophila kikkawai]
MFQLSSAIALCILLQGTLSHPSDNQDKELPRIAEEPLTIGNQCNGYCFSVLKPILDHFVSLKEGADASSEFRDKIHSLEETVKHLQGQLENTKTQLKDNENLIKEKDERINDLQGQLNSTTARFTEISDQLRACKQTEENLPNTCPSGSPNGIYQIKLRGSPAFKVPCVSAASGWTVVLSRFDGSENFNRTWRDYRNGFGDFSGEFFIGLEKLHLMTRSQHHELYIQLRDVNGSTAIANYDDFIVGSEQEEYKLKSLGKYSGTAGDSLRYHLDKKFTTTDRDNDLGDGHCVSNHGGGGWWYGACAQGFLTGKYYKDGRRLSKDYGIIWVDWRNFNVSLTFAQMMIRPQTIRV